MFVMIATARTTTIFGIDAEIIRIEVDMFPAQLPGLVIVGLPDKIVQEAKERIVAAIKNSGFDWPRKKIVVNLAPADIPKSGTSFDLPIAIAILLSSGQVVFDPQDYLLAGELSLDGSLRHINGALSIAFACSHSRIPNLIVPTPDAVEAAVAHVCTVIGGSSLRAVVEHLNGTCPITPTTSDWSDHLSETFYEHDFATIKGQSTAKRAAIIAASGGHNMLLRGTPGSGKTLLSKAMASILPKLSFEESLEITRIYSVANMLEQSDSLIVKRPFRSPHHTASTVSIVGGGKVPKPGELSLAHRGILFLDEFPEFSSYSLEALRQPLEDRKVVVSRAAGTITYPANFMLVAAMNPCKCGWYGDKERECTCTPFSIERYVKRISGPILDRIDLQIDVPRVSVQELSEKSERTDENSSTISTIVQSCRDLQLKRFAGKALYCNADMMPKDVETFCIAESDAKALLMTAVDRLHLSARAYFRLLKVARTIADLDESDIILKRHIAEAVQYRIAE